MDQADEAIVELLQRNGRLTHGQIAGATGLSRSTTAARIQRLLDSGQVQVRGVVHPAVVGWGSLAYVSLVVRGAATTLAARIAERPDVPLVSLTTGRHAIVAEVRAASHLEIDRAVGELRALDGVQGVDTLSYVELVRDVIGPVGEVSYAVDETDLALLRALQEDGRASYVALAELVGLSPAGARRRVLRLLEEQVVRVGAVVRRGEGDRHASMGLGLRLDGSHEDVVAALGAMPTVTFVARTVGRFDVLATIRARATAPLVSSLETVRGLAGVNEVESWSHLSVVKESYAAVGLGARPDEPVAKQASQVYR
jgi:DNA-binding Lrp family transcriptional regulator